MPAMEEALCEYLLSISAITSLIGTGDSARLWPDALPQQVSMQDGPALTYAILDSIEPHLLSDRSGIVKSRVQISAFAATRKAANALARAAKNCGLLAFKGLFAGVDFRGATIERGISHFTELPTDGGQELRYLCDFDFVISYRES
jgi:hypothetical protein